MPIKFQIVGDPGKEKLLVTDQGTGAVYIHKAAHECWYYVKWWEEKNLIQIIDNNGTSSRASRLWDSIAIGDAVDENDVVFTKSSWFDWAGENLANFKTASGGSEVFKYEGAFLNYSALTLAFPAGDVGRFAFVLESQGTRWLPWSLGGTYYGAGWYYDNGVDWISANDEIFEGLENLQRQYSYWKAGISRVGQTTIPLANTQSLVYENYIPSMSFTADKSATYFIGANYIWSTNSTFQNFLCRLRIVHQGGGLNETIQQEQEGKDAGGTGIIVNVLQGGNIVGNVNTGTDQRVPTSIGSHFDLLAGETYDVFLEFTAPPGHVPTIYSADVWASQKTSN